MKKLFFCILIGLTAVFFIKTDATAQAAAVVTGQVTRGGEPVADVAAQLIAAADKQVKSETRTDKDGKFIFINVAAGKYLIAVACETCPDKRDLTELNVAKGSNLTVNIELPALVVERVTIISSGTNKPENETSKTVSVLENQQIENRNEQTVVDALRTVPGFRVQQLGGFGRLASIKIRGLRNQDTAILIDGQRLRDATGIAGDAAPFLGDLAVTSVRKIEVMRGAGSSLYGTNAIGGVVNVLSDNFGDDMHGSFLGEGGVLGMFRGRADFSGGFKARTFFDVALSHINITEGIDENDAARNTGGKVGFRQKFNDKATFTARFYLSDAFVELNSNPDTIGTLPTSGIITARPLSRAELRRYENGTSANQLTVGGANFIPDANDGDAIQRSRFYNFHAAFDGVINSIATYRFSYQDLTTRRKNFNGPSGTGFQPFGGVQRSDFDGRIQTFQTKTNIVAKSNLITIGYGYEREKYGNDNFEPGSPVNKADAAQSSNTFVLQDQLEAFDSRLQLTGAFRAQFFALEKPVFSPSANPPYGNVTLAKPPTSYTYDGSIGYYFPQTGTKLRAHAGNGYRAPSLYERFGSFYDSFFAQNFVPLGDPRLKPERSFGVDTGVDQRLWKEKARVSAVYFYTKLIDTIGFSNNLTGDPFGRFFGYFNTKGGIARGGELSAEITPSNSLNFFTSYTFTKSQQREAQVAGSGVLRTLGVPDHQFSLVATQDFGKRLNVTFDLVATSSYLAPIFSNTTFATRIYRFKGQRKGDLTAAYTIPTSKDRLRFRIFGMVENLFDTEYFENGFRTAGRGARGGLQVKF
jgi:iron complex outermembrane receptor protein